MFSGFSESIRVFVDSAKVRDGMLAYSIRIKNESKVDLILTDIRGEYYSIHNDCVYIEMYAHNPFLHLHSMMEYVPTSDDFKLLKRNEVLTVSKAYYLSNYENNNFHTGYPFKNNSKLKVFFLIGYFTADNQAIKQTYTYEYLNENQHINEVISKAEFRKLKKDAQLKFLFSNWKYYSQEYEISDYANIASENINESEELIYYLKNSNFFEKNGRREYSINSISNIFKNLIQTKNNIDFYELKRLIKGKLILQTPESLGSSKEYRDLLICINGYDSFSNFINNYKENAIYKELKKKYVNFKEDNGDITDYLFCYSILYDL
jgi:hypothetical protein